MIALITVVSAFVGGFLAGLWIRHKEEEEQRKADDEAVWGQD